MDVNTLRQAIGLIRAHLEDQFEVLNTLDGQLGDGDLGITLIKAFRELETVAPQLPDDLGAALMQSAAAVTRVSSSSFGTLLATGLMAGARLVKGQTQVAPGQVVELLQAALEAMSTRGKANLGDKTVLDGLAAVIAALRRAEPNADLIAVAAAAAAHAVEEFRGQPARIGRARMFGDKTIGMTDPGMVALATLANGLAVAKG